MTRIKISMKFINMLRSCSMEKIEDLKTQTFHKPGFISRYYIFPTMPEILYEATLKQSSLNFFVRRPLQEFLKILSDPSILLFM